MARIKVDNEKIIEMNELYLKLGSYAAVAREVGCAPTTVKKYIIPNYVSKDNIKKKIFQKEDLPEFSNERFIGVKDYGDLCVLSPEEKKEIEELWNEMVM